MANIYVNLTEAAGGVLTNGYAYGDDARDRATAASKLTPVATLIRANAISLDNDTIIINDGTYLEATFVNLAKNGITIKGENSGMAIIRNNTPTVRVLHTTKTDLTLNGIILDAENTSSGCLTLGGATDLNVTIIGGGFLNPTGNFAVLSRMGDITMSGGWSASATALTGDGISIDYGSATGTAGNISISDGTINILDASTNVKGIFVSSDLAGCTCEIYDVNITMGTTTSSNTVYGIFVDSMQSLNIYNNIIDLNDSLSAWGILADVSAVDNTDVCNIYSNTVNAPYGATTGLGVQCGSNEDTSPTGVGSLKNARVYNNTVTGSNHGVFIGWLTGAKLYGNTCIDNTLGTVNKGTTSCDTAGNIIIDCFGNGALLAKGDTNSNISNNTVITNSGVTTIAMISARISGITNSTGTIYSNNILLNNGGTVTKLVNYIASQTATFTNNNYYSTIAIPSNSWVYAGANVADFTAWIALSETTGELNVNSDLDASYNLNSTSALIGAGSKWWTGANPVGADGEPFSDFATDIGGIQSTYGPFHPVNL